MTYFLRFLLQSNFCVLGFLLPVAFVGFIVSACAGA